MAFQIWHEVGYKKKYYKVPYYKKRSRGNPGVMNYKTHFKTAFQY